ncbi:HD-GYP domain-containing protein [Deinococcus radiotolerans]|uniref:Phosphohydrolase n=1 Tax=Deinococcus radiotolerans TaxID=1309407 RepID=A0ABQ2FMD3_9DEIO|nr:HD-GYP domain-containing protein [Deinococcus radiotolerans]GGL09190.1 phosphohydrolase [Deinococcus radiotolerans]
MDQALLPDILTQHLTQVGLTASSLSTALRPVVKTLTARTDAGGAAYYQLEEAAPGGYGARVTDGAAPGVLPDAVLRDLRRTDDLLSVPGSTRHPDLLIAPIRERDDALLGALLLARDTYSDWTASERTLLHTLAGLVALVAARLHAEARERNAHEQALRTLGLALEARDLETFGHTDRVTQLATQVGRAMRLPPDTLDALRWGAYLHDIGKLTLPDDLLHHPGPLTPAMCERMREHVGEGLRIAQQLPFLPREALDVIAAHHERWDGTGYPCGRSGAAIPLPARIFAACDVFDALISPRVYKPAWTAGDALQFVQQGSGTHFDPQVVQALTQVLGQRVISSNDRSSNIHSVHEQPSGNVGHAARTAPVRLR